MPTATPIPRPVPVVIPTKMAAPTAHPLPKTIEIPRVFPPSSKPETILLNRINAVREKAGVPLVALGDNRAAQIHAENSIEQCFSGHWGVDGLRSGMRYNLAGGYQHATESSIGYGYCVGSNPRSVQTQAWEAITKLMESPPHRKDILNPDHRKVNLGIAENDAGLVNIVLQFEGDYVAYSEVPQLDGETLSMAGTIKNGVNFASEKSLKVDIYYDPPPTPLTRGQLSMAYCEDVGVMVGALIPPAPPGYSWSGLPEKFDFAYQRCKSPYDVADDTPPPATASEETLRGMQSRLNNPYTYQTGARWVIASKWRVDNQAFAVKADLSEVLEEHGKGIYTLMVWGVRDGNPAVISSVALFYGTPRPTGYD